MNTNHSVWERVKVQGVDECWPWQGYIRPDGYGEICIDYESTPAHVAAFRSKKGIIPPGRIIMHKCNNRYCCNPKHLEAGTYSNNQQHAVKSGAFSPGISGIVGVRYDAGRQRWISSARLKGKRHNLYQGRDFFAACCARKAWDAKQL